MSSRKKQIAQRVARQQSSEFVVDAATQRAEASRAQREAAQQKHDACQHDRRAKKLAASLSGAAGRYHPKTAADRRIDQDERRRRLAQMHLSREIDELGAPEFKPAFLDHLDGSRVQRYRETLAALMCAHPTAAHAYTLLFRADSRGGPITLTAECDAAQELEMTLPAFRARVGVAVRFVIREAAGCVPARVAEYAHAHRAGVSRSVRRARARAVSPAPPHRTAHH